MAHYIIEKEGNYMLVPLPDEAWAILQSQLINKKFIFPFISSSITAGFQRVRDSLGKAG